MPYKNSEKRKEKSRDAARNRRGKELEVFNELARCLPLQDSVLSQLDKASVMRLSISCLRMQHILRMQHWADEDKKAGVQGMLDHLFPKALDGFVFILSQEADIVYVNENVVKYLGIQQIELMGQSILDFCDPRDEDEIREAVSLRSHGGKHTHGDKEDRVFFIRLKCTLTSKGRNVNLKSASYKVIRCRGRMVVPSDMGQAGAFPYLLCEGEPVPHPANIEVPLDQHTFLSKHDMDMKFTYCDDRVKDLLNYSSEDLMGRSLLDYHHAGDSAVVDGAYKDLLCKGQTMTGHYRFLARGGGWGWVITQATVIHNNRNHKAQWVVCVHHVLSHVEKPDLILSEVQTECCGQLAEEEPKLMIMCTESIFSPKTADMDKGYFIPPHMRNKMKMTKTNEPEDLSYLAPTAGDAGIPLELPFCWQGVDSSHRADSSKLRSEEVDLTPPPSVLLEGLKQEPGLSPPLCPPPPHHWHHALSSTRSPTASSVSPSSSCSSRMSSPHDYVSQATPQTLHCMEAMDQFFNTLEMKCHPAKDDIDIQSYSETDRSPYIPMNMADDRLVIPPSTEAIFSLQNDVNPALQGKTEYVFRSKMNNSIFEEPPPPPRPSMRDMLEGSTAVASIEQPEDIMFKQIKRPLDMNSLEKGPPPRKLLCRLGQGHNPHHPHPPQHAPHRLPHPQRQTAMLPPLPPPPPPSAPLQQQRQQQRQIPQLPADSHTWARPFCHCPTWGQQSKARELSVSSRHEATRVRGGFKRHSRNVDKSGKHFAAKCERGQEKMAAEKEDCVEVTGSGQKMLVNLLLTGQDPSGYSTMALDSTIPQPKGGGGSSSHLINPLLCLTQHDCDVNAPIQCGPLLDGDDLLTALETVMAQTPQPVGPALE